MGTSVPAFLSSEGLCSLLSVGLGNELILPYRAAITSGHLSVTSECPSKLSAALQDANLSHSSFLLSESPMEKHRDARTEEMLLGW